jgi:hypothetical protein
VTKKTVLTLACMGLDWNLRSQIVKFNRTSDQYRIEVQDYSEYNTGDDYTAGLTKLGTEILSGKVPDHALHERAAGQAVRGQGHPHGSAAAHRRGRRAHPRQL